MVVEMDFFQTEAGAGKVLMMILEDLDVGGMMAAPLQAAGYICEIAHDPDQAMEWLDSLQPDAVIMDYFLQETNGLNVLKGLRLKPITQNTPVLFMSKIPEEFVPEAQKYSPVDILEEAYDAAELRRKIDALFI